MFLIVFLFVFLLHNASAPHVITTWKTQKLREMTKLDLPLFGISHRSSHICGLDNFYNSTRLMGRYAPVIIDFLPSSSKSGDNSKAAIQQDVF
jgi:hypothetical protein